MNAPNPADPPCLYVVVNEHGTHDGNHIASPRDGDQMECVHAFFSEDSALRWMNARFHAPHGWRVVKMVPETAATPTP